MTAQRPTRWIAGLAVPGLGIAGVAVWLAFALAAGVAEPWDAPLYWSVAYPALVLVSGLAGYGLAGFGLAGFGLAGSGAGRHAAWAGIVLTLSQLPVMLMLAGVGAMWPAGLMLLGALAVPPALVSALSGWLGVRAGWRR